MSGSVSVSVSEKGNFLTASNVELFVVALDVGSVCTVLVVVAVCVRLFVTVSSVFVMVCERRGDAEADVSGVGVLGFDVDEHVDEGEL